MTTGELLQLGLSVGMSLEDLTALIEARDDVRGYVLAEERPTGAPEAQ